MPHTTDIAETLEWAETKLTDVKEDDETLRTILTHVKKTRSKKKHELNVEALMGSGFRPTGDSPRTVFPIAKGGELWQRKIRGTNKAVVVARTMCLNAFPLTCIRWNRR